MCLDLQQTPTHLEHAGVVLSRSVSGRPLLSTVCLVCESTSKVWSGLARPSQLCFIGKVG